MYDKILEQAQAATKPMTDLFALNSKTIESLTEKQTGLVSEILNHNMSFAKNIAAQKDITSIYETQKSYVEGIQEKMVAATKDTYSIISTAQEEATSLVQGAVKETQKTAAKAAKATKA